MNYRAKDELPRISKAPGATNALNMFVLIMLWNSCVSEHCSLVGGGEFAVGLADGYIYKERGREFREC